MKAWSKTKKIVVASILAIAIILFSAIAVNEAFLKPHNTPPDSGIAQPIAQPTQPPVTEAPKPAPEVPVTEAVQPPESLPAPEGPTVPEAPVRSFTEAPTAPTRIPVDPVPSPNPVLPVPIPEPQPLPNLPDISAGTEVQITIPSVPEVVNQIPPVVEDVTKPLTEIPLPVIPEVIKETNGILDQGIRTDPLLEGGAEVRGDVGLGLGG